jgi:F-type H+-transporting ATPase subunit delta
MTEQRVSLRYARALFETAKGAGSIDTVYKDFSTISGYFSVSRELLTVLKSPVVQTWKKKQLFKELFSNIVSELTYNFLVLLTEKQRENFLPDIIAYFEKLYLTEKNIIKADITTARDIDDTLRGKIVGELETKLSKTVIPSFKVDSLIKGGLMIRVEDWVYDATVRNQLNQLRTKLIEGKLV